VCGANKEIKPSPFQNSYAEGLVVRLRMLKGKLGKFDKPNRSDQKCTITTVLQQSEDSINHTSAKLSRYKRTPFGGRKKSAGYVGKSLLEILEILKPPKKSTPPLPPIGFDGHTANTAVLLHVYDISAAFLSNFWRQVTGRPRDLARVRKASSARPRCVQYSFLRMSIYSFLLQHDCCCRRRHQRHGRIQ
jgi:hypothetical protein